MNEQLSLAEESVVNYLLEGVLFEYKEPITELTEIKIKKIFEDGWKHFDFSDLDDVKEGILEVDRQDQIPCELVAIALSECWKTLNWQKITKVIVKDSLYYQEHGEYP